MRPYMILTSVDFPAPFSPRRAWISAGYRSRSIESLARNVPYRFVMPSARSSGSLPEETFGTEMSCIGLSENMPFIVQGSFHSPRDTPTIQSRRRGQAQMRAVRELECWTRRTTSASPAKQTAGEQRPRLDQPQSALADTRKMSPFCHIGQNSNLVRSGLVKN